MSDLVKAYVALGANLGDRLATFQDAVQGLDDHAEVSLIGLSGLYETAPVGGPEGQTAYFNAAAAIETTLAPMDLLSLLQTLEAKHHRKRDVSWGPRTLDLDLLFFGDRVIESERLTVPHPRLHERRFVLQPLCDIAPELRHPLLEASSTQLLERLPEDDKDDVVLVSRDWR